MARKRGRPKGKGKSKLVIKRPGALTRAKKRNERIDATARRLKKSGTPLQKKQANFYLNVLKKRKKKK